MSATYDLFRATSVIGAWESVAALAAQLDGTVEYVDGPLLNAAFYRMRMASRP